MDISNKANDFDMEGKYLTFIIEKQLFAIPIYDVVQIVGMQKITDMPDSPNYVKGIINIRGSIIPVIDFRLRLGKQEKEYNERTCIIVTNIDIQEIGLVVDEVDSVINIEDEYISKPPQMNVTSNSCITGIAKLANKVILILDAAIILNENVRKYYDENPEE